jgi:dipeptidyl aminopeptidase/acylaminoacyl peptidase
MNRCGGVDRSRTEGDALPSSLDFQTQRSPLIPRRKLLGNPTSVLPKLSPDGRRLAWQAPVDGVMNIWLAPADDLKQAQPLTRLGGRPPGFHGWSSDGRFILFFKDANGDENYNLYVADPATGQVRNLTQMPKVNVYLLLLSPELPSTILIGLNDRDPRWHDVWSLDLATGERILVYENTERFGGFLPDWQGRVRLAGRSDPANGGQHIYLSDGERWEQWRVIPFEDSLSTGTLFFNRAGTHLNMLSSVGRDTTAMFRVDMTSGEETLLAEHPGADLGEFIVDPQTFEIDAVAAAPVRKQWTFLTPSVEETLSLVQAAAPEDELSVLSASADNRRWIVTAYGPRCPPTYLLVDRDRRNAAELFCARPELKAYRLASMQGVVVTSRGGLGLVCYVTLPAEVSGLRPAAPLPMVLLVHGGPWGRDGYDYRRDHQWLANRGYAVLSVNYRASTGFGKAFVNAGDGEHAGRMHDGLIDAVEWAIGEGIADREKVAIMGISYGGYASFVGATFTPEVFCCSIPIVGITDLATLMENAPPYWADFMEQFYRRYADVRTDEGRAFLRSRSPLYKADQIRKPMLIGHGANDVRCTLAQSDAIVAAMQELGLPVTYVVYPDEGHGFLRSENNLAFNAIVEAFLGRYLGGRAEPIGEDFQGSSQEIRAGAEFVEALQD